ncbi:hypothetical protein ACG2F4_07210 [Halalkalibaculum sp. DA3122]|uniref:hypothetical protein n=1 Tax=Halalkalibaculum sp. DA3122 TaxID=3373607 RepID=UPI00375486FC
MRLDKLIKKLSSEVTEEQYNRIKNHQIFTIEYSDEEGWDFGELDQLSEPQAKRLLQVFERVKQYEKENHIEPQIHSVIVNLAAENREPEWPEELQGDDTPYLFEAFLRQKFGIKN